MALVQTLTSPVEGISCHAWNGDRTQIAVCPNSNEIHIYDTRNWIKLHTLTEHDLLVTAIDWSPVTNKIVSCSHDRNAFVWTYDDDASVWRPSLVLLRIDRAALDVKWSHDGVRFAVASGAKSVPVCTYEASQDWWVSKLIKKKFKSTVLCCAFHPSNGQLLATGCADFKCRVISTFNSDVDGMNVNFGPFASTHSPVEFGEVYVELSSQSWVHAVAWSPSGNSLAYASHDSRVYVATFGVSAEPPVQVIRLPDLPFTSLMFLSERAFVGAGYDFNPAIYKLSGSAWTFHGLVDDVESSTGAASPVAETSNAARARELFRSKTTRGNDGKTDSDILKTKHERFINCIQNATRGSGPITTISTSAYDGKLVQWNLQSLDVKFSQLSL
jgi:actin related protein 2/3 complex subunit 1A/1B